MKMKKVSSSNIAKIGYSPLALELFVEFKNGKTFSYKYVSPWEYENMLNAGSVGKHFNQHVKPGRIAVEVKAEQESAYNNASERLKSALAYIVRIREIAIREESAHVDIARLAGAALEVDEAKSNS